MSATWLSVYPPLPPGVHLRRPAAPPLFPLDEPGCRVFAQARQGLWHGVRRLGLAAGDAVLVPAYHHGSEVQTLVEAGAVPRFYGAAGGIEPDPQELESLLGPRVRALYVIHALGFPQDGARWRRWCDERGLLLIEDGAQAWLSSRDGRPTGATADLAIFCLYKMLPLPDGGATLCTAPPAPPQGTRRGARSLVRLHRDWLAQRWSWLSGLRGGAANVHAAPEVPERDFALRGTDEPAAGITRFLLPRLDGAAAAQRRRANYRFLAQRLGDRVPPEFAALPDGASPLAFPVEARDKRRLLEHLAARGIVNGRMWMVAHPSLDVEAFPAAARLRASLVGLPVHQELGERHLERIVAAMATS